LLFVAGAAASAGISSRLSFNFSLPASPTYKTGATIYQDFHGGGTSAPVVLAVPNPHNLPSDPAQPAEHLSAIVTEVQHQFPLVRIEGPIAPPRSASRSGSGAVTLVYVFAPAGSGFSPNPVLGQVVRAFDRLMPAPVGVTGLSQLQSSGGSASGPGLLLESLLAGLGALVVLAVVFSSLLAGVPLVLAAVAVLATFLCLYGLSYLTQVSFVVEFLVGLVGLGVSIDYSLLVVTRWREERARGATNEAAIVAAVDTAGRAVALSGTLVGIGLLALVISPVPLLRSTGLGGLLIPLLSVSATLTLLPAILAGIGPRLDWPHRRHEERLSRPWAAWARLVVRRRWPAAVVAVAVLLIAALPVGGLALGQTSAAAEATTGPAHQALADLESAGYPIGILTPIELLTRATPTAVTAVTDAAEGTPGVATVTLPTFAPGLADVLAIPDQETVNTRGFSVVSELQSDGHRLAGFIGLAGVGAFDSSYVQASYSNVPLVAALIGLLMLVVLTLALRSPVLAIKAVVLNIVSMAASLGIVTWFWQEGHGSMPVFAIPATNAITFWVPVAIFSLLFGLSMDYEVFILSRMREATDNGLGSSEAVVEGLGRTGRLVTSAALILFLALVSLAAAPMTDLKVMATGIGIGVLVDATVIRALLVPALVALLGRWNWWCPNWLSRLVRPVQPSPAVPASVNS
jgi:RND superfamily putative drug exporter